MKRIIFACMVAMMIAVPGVYADENGDIDAKYCGVYHIVGISTDCGRTWRSGSGVWGDIKPTTVKLVNKTFNVVAAFECNAENINDGTGIGFFLDSDNGDNELLKIIPDEDLPQVRRTIIFKQDGREMIRFRCTVSKNAYTKLSDWTK